MPGIHPSCIPRLYVIPPAGPVCMKCGKPLSDLLAWYDEMQSHTSDSVLSVSQSSSELQDPYSASAPRHEFCYDCSRRVHQYVQGKALYLYRGDIKVTMYHFKYSNKREYAAFFARQAVEMYGRWLRHNQIDVIIPVPMYAPKQRRRGYNQAEVFARALTRETGIPTDSHLIRRTRNTTPQKELNDQQRKNNLKNAFNVDQSIVKYRYILLIDDIYTTGSTMDAVAGAIQQAGVNQIFFLSVCIGKGL